MSSLDSSDLATGKKFSNKLLYVQHVDKEKDKTSEIPELLIEEYLLGDRKFFPGLNNPKTNVGILKSALNDKIAKIEVYSNPLEISLGSDVAIHAFVVFKTKNYTDFKKTWWSLEKNTECIVLQQSPNEVDVINKLYNTEKKDIRRLEPVKKLTSSFGNCSSLEELLRAIWKTNQPSNYHLVNSNCQHFASFVYEKFNDERKKWSASVIVERLGTKNQKSQSGIEVDSLKYKSIKNDGKFVYYRAMIEGRKQDFEKLANNLTIESINDVDSQGYTLLEWATVFTTSNWLIDQFFKEKGAVFTPNKGLFHRNVFFIALQYLPPNKKVNSKLLSFDGIDIDGVNKTGDTALHLALYGEKWEITDNILSQFKDYDVNVTNSSGYTPLLLAAQLKCGIDLFKKILNKTNAENVNKHDETGYTVLQLAINNEWESAIKELLQNKDVDVNVKVKNNKSLTELHLANSWPKIPVGGRTILQNTIFFKSETVANELLTHKDVNVDVRDNDNNTALHCACEWTDIPIYLFQTILGKSADCNAKNNYGETALHYAFHCKSETAIQELLKHDGVDVNAKNQNNHTALHLTSWWTNIPVGLLKIILERVDIKAKDIDGNTALHFAIINKSEVVANELLKHKDLDVSVKNDNNQTPLDLASKWKNIPVNLLKMISGKLT